MEITVNGEVLTPRMRMASAPFAYQAEKLDGFEGAEFVKKAGDTMTGNLQVAGTVYSTTGGIKFPDGTVQTTSATTGGNTLDQAYDQGGSGAGRTITADAGAVNIAGPGGLTVGGSVGIGTTSPTGSLEISSANPYPLKVATTDPVARFMLEGSASSTIRASDLSTAKSLILQATSSGQTGAYVQVDGKDQSGSSGTGSGIVLLESARQSPTGDILFRTQGLDRLIVDQSGNVGIGTNSPRAGLEVNVGTSNGGQIIHAGAPRILFETGPTHFNWRISAQDLTNAAFEISVGQQDGDATNDTYTPVLTALQSGHVRVPVLEVIGGSDIAEPFPMVSGQRPLPGMVLAIDDANPGHLRLSVAPYERGVAGVVSGAGGVNAGLTLGQVDELGAGPPVAMSGRAYCLATTANGPITPGDLLTTSDMPGHAMKATDPTRSHGAILGKAMSNLKQGEGLVLVLVNLH